LLDLDGVVYVGDHAVPHAAEALEAARTAGMHLAFVTNNALRTPEEVAARLTGLGVQATADQVVTSAQAAARVLAGRLSPGSKVLVAGGAGLREAVRAAGLTPVAGADDEPQAVVTGHDPEQTWARLAEATLALSAGVLWVASNIDANIPDARGKLPGAGAIVALLSVAAERPPDVIAGKPHPAMHAASVERTGATRPLVVGDRLDTDIEGANAAGVDSLLVFTGVTEPADVVNAPEHQRPTYLAQDLRGLLSGQPAAELTEGTARVGSATATLAAGVLTVQGPDAMDRVRAACALAWTAPSPPTAVSGL
jgi:HAD superfamily hydrolase (TIGR01450 family)